MKKAYILTPLVTTLVIVLLSGSVFAAGIELEKQISIDGGESWADADSAPGPVVTEGTGIQFKYILTNTEEVPLTYDLTDSDLGLLVDDGTLDALSSTEITPDPLVYPYVAGPGNAQYETWATVEFTDEDLTPYDPVVDSAFYYSTIAATSVEIDIKPGSDPNSINLKSRGVIPVALLSSGDFDATTIFGSETEPLDPSIYLAGSGGQDVRWAIEDVNEDNEPFNDLPALDSLFEKDQEEILDDGEDRSKSPAAKSAMAGDHLTIGDVQIPNEPEILAKAIRKVIKQD